MAPAAIRQHQAPLGFNGLGFLKKRERRLRPQPLHHLAQRLERPGLGFAQLLGNGRDNGPCVGGVILSSFRSP